MTTSIISQIEEMVANIPGWSTVDQLYTLFNLAYCNSYLPGDIVEIGSWCGRSASVLGLAAKTTGNTKVICIDLFPEMDDWRQNKDGSYSFKIIINSKKYGGHIKQTVWKVPFERDMAPLYERHHSIFDIFWETIVKNDLMDFVRPYKGTSEIIRTIATDKFKCKLAFIDGEHSYEAVCQDVANIEPYLIEGGWLCFDDAFTSYEGVTRAINDLIINNNNYEFCQQMTRKLFVARKIRTEVNR